MADPVPSENIFDQYDPGKTPIGIPAPETTQDNQPAPQANPFDDLGDVVPEPVSTTGAVARGAEKSVLPAAGSLAAAGAGAELGGAAGTAVLPGIGTAVGALAGGIGGGILGAKGIDAAQNWLLSKLPDSYVDAFGLDERKERLDQQQHPVASFVGGLVPYAVTMRPSGFAKTALPENATALQTLMSHPVTAKLFGGGVMGGMELANEKADGQDLDWRKVAIATGFGVIFNKPNMKIGEPITEFGAGPVRGVLGRPGPTVAQAGDLKVMGPGVTESVFHGTQEQAPEAAMMAQETARTEQAALGEAPEPDVGNIARRMEPDLFGRYDDLLKRQETFQAWHGEGPGAESAEKHLAATTAEIDQLGPEVAAAYRRAADTMGTGTVAPEQFPSLAAMLAAHEHQTGVVPRETNLPEVSNHPAPLARGSPDAVLPAVHPGSPEGLQSEFSGQTSETEPEGVIGQPPAPNSIPRPQRSIGEQRAFIANDVSQKLIAAGRPAEEAEASGQLIAARYVTRAGRFEGKLGTPEELYSREAAAIAGPTGKPQEPAQPPAWVPEEARAAPAEDLNAMLARKATPAEISQHPIVKAANETNRAVPRTDLRPDYGTPEFEANREFNINGEKVTGYEQALPKLVDKAKSYSTKGPVKQEREATIVLGPPAAGKSRLSERLASEKHAAIADPDDVKMTLPEYAGGLGSTAVHEESAKIAGNVLHELVKNGDNIVLPRVGGKLESVKQYVDALHDAGYKVNMVNMTVEPHEAYRRMIGRFLKTGRIIGSDYFEGVGTKPRENFYAVKDEGKIHEAVDVDANGPAGSAKAVIGGDTELAKALALGGPGGGGGQALAGGHPEGEEVSHAEPVQAALDAADRANEKAALPEYSQAAEQAPKGPDQPSGVFMFDPTALNVDAKRFQFKSGGDEYGVTGALRNVTKWDPAKAQSIIVWEANDGKLYVADGHQRAGLARRLTEQGKEKNIQLPGVLYREKDGISADDIRAIAAVTNIANGSGSALDGAKVLRARPDLMDGSLPLSVGKGKQAAALARLGDEPFRMVVNDVVPENYGAVVGELIPNDPARQEAALKAIARFEPKNTDEAAVLTQRVAQAELAKAETGAQTSMFGDLETPESTAGEEMKIVGRAISDLKKDKALFSRVLANAERIEQTGSQIERGAAQGVTSDAEKFAKTLTSEAYTAGPLRTELIAAARDLKNGKASIGEATGRILAALRTQAEAHGADRAGPVGVEPKEYAQSDQFDFEAGAEGKPQSLVPGVKPVSQRDLIQAAANKPLRGGNKPPPEGGLFGSSMDQKELFQIARGKIRIAEGRRPIITLLKDANPSTFIHESGHQFLEELMRDADHPEAPPGLRDDAQTVRDWLGVTDDIKTKHHEKFARGFEQYMREGVAPSPGLAGVFAKFRNWLLTIYQSLKGLGAEINPDIRGVFDRMLEMEPQRTVVAPERQSPTLLHDIHEAEAANVPPHEAEATMDRVVAERDRYISEQPPEVQRELEAAASKVEAVETAAGKTSGAPGEAFSSAVGQPEVGEGGGGPGPQSGGGPSGEEHAEVKPSGANAGAEGAASARPDPRSGLSNNAGTALAPGPTDLFGARESPFTDKAGNIRVENLTTREDVAQAIRDSASENNDFIGDRRGVITDGQVMELADALGMDAQSLNQRQLGQAFNAEQIVAARKLLIQSATDVSGAMKKAATGTDQDVMAYAMAKDRHQMIQAQVAGITAEAGRALRAFRSIAGEEGAQAADQFIKTATGKTLFQLRQEAKLGAALQTPQQVSKMMNDAQKHSFGSMVLEYWINGLISGPATHMTYTVGNTISSILKFPETAAAAAVARAAGMLGRKGASVRAGEAGAMARGAAQGFPAAVKAGVEALKTGVTTQLPGEVAPQGSLPLQPGTDLAQPAQFQEGATYHDAMAATFGIIRGMRDGIMASGKLLAAGGVQGEPLVGTQYSPLGAIPDITLKGVNVLPLGSVVRIPGRFIASIHSFYRSINFSMEKNALAYRKAAEEGLTGDALASRVAQIRADPSEAQMNEIATHAATQTVLMGKGSELTQALSRVTNAKVFGFPLLKFIDPFVHISGNIIEQAVIQRTPVGLLTMLGPETELARDLTGKNGNASQDKAIGRMMVGTALSVTFGGLAAQGLMSGSGPSDPKESAMWRLAGNQAHSIRIGDMWYDTHRLGPIGMLAGIAADMYDVSHDAAKGDLLQAAAHLQHAFAQNILDESFMRGPAELIQAIEDPGRYGESYIRNFLSSFVPFSVGMSQMARATDPYTRLARTTTDAIKAKIPGLSETLMPRRDIWGEPMPSREVLGPAGLSAIYAQRMSNDPVNKAMLDIGVYPAQVEKTIRNVTLTPQEYDTYAQVAGRLVKRDLDKVVNSPMWQTMPIESKRYTVKHILEMDREGARGIMFGKYPHLVHDGTEAQKRRAKGEKL